MINQVGSLIDILEIAMDTCCKRHNMCRDCLHLNSCVKIWDKASEQSITKEFTPHHLRAYIDEFNQLWEDGRHHLEDSAGLN